MESNFTTSSIKSQTGTRNLAAAVLGLLAAFDIQVATAATNSPSPAGGQTRYPPHWAAARQSRAASRFALGAGKTNAATAGTYAQTAPSPFPSRSGERSLVEVGPNSRTWTIVHKSGVSTNGAPSGPSRSGVPQRGGGPGGKVVEIATGMNYWDGQSWTPSDATFDLADGAFVANRVQHRTRLNANLNVIGAVTTTLADGTTLRSTPVAIGLYDPNDGRFAVVSTLTNTLGVLAASNQVVYPDAFSGGACADVVYTLQQGSFSQDVVITGRLNPLDYGFPTNAQIQILTEFYDPPQPEKIRRPIRIEQNEKVRRRMVSPDLVDEVLGFSELVMGTGRAFTQPSATHTEGAQAVVAKEFRAVPEARRTFLIESVSCPAIQKALNALPKCGGARTALHIRKRTARYALLPRPGQGTQAKARPAKPPLQQAQANPLSRPGVVIDYIETLGGTLNGAKVFAADTTYLVNGWVCCNGPVTIEAAVFKYKAGASIFLNNTLTCKTSSYQPAVFTCIDDDSIGASCDQYQGYTGTINPAGYANPALDSEWSGTPSLSNIRICYAQEALRLGGAYVNATIAHAQILHCIQGIVLAPVEDGSGSGSGFYVTINNALFSLVNYALVETGGSGSGPPVSASLWNCTVDNSLILATDEHYEYPSLTVTFRNSVLANISDLGNAAVYNSAHNGFYASPLFGDPASQWTVSESPFQSSGGGAYYLKGDSVFRAKGTTTGLPSALLPSLKTRTTQPPMVFPRFKQVTGDLTLFPEVPRYVSGAPDLGYWYDALDYTVASMWLEGASIIVQPGTAVGFRNEYAPELFWPWWWTLEGFELWEGSSFISRGLPTRPIVFADAQTVQEQAGLATAAFFVPWFLLDPNNTPPPVADFRFSNFYAAPGARPGYIHLGSFASPDFYASPGSFHFWGGLDRLEDALSANSTVNLTLRDCSLQGGAVNLGKDVDSVMNLPCNVSWINTLFDRVDFNLDPDWVDQFDPTLYVDLAFQGYNNLFRGGRLRMVPISSTTGNWVFKDNLFDKIGFEQDATVSLDHDYNGYWKRLPSELESGQTDRLTPNAANDKVVSSAPYYQAGPLGSYYLPAYGLLYNGGSRTPGEAGLYHYTTRTDQTKDGLESPSVVNIGLHYVATVNPSSTQPKDSDAGGADGIPDYVENWHGDGIYHAGTETKWQENYTTPGVQDRNNDLYQDADLDGDGMVGRIEAALSKLPLTPDNPLTLIPAASPGPNRVAFVVPVPFTTLAGIANLSLRQDGRPVPLLRWDQDASGGCLLTWDTTYEMPGEHCAQVELYLNGQTRPGAMGSISALAVSVEEPPYVYPLTPGTAAWVNCDPFDRVNSVVIPQTYLDTASSWQVFCSAVANPYFRGFWVPGDSMTDCYAAAKTVTTLSVLAQVEDDPGFAANVLRFLGSVNPNGLATSESWDTTPSLIDYVLACYMAGLTKALSSMDQQSLEVLFARAAWDANSLLSASHSIAATAPLVLMYKAYAGLSQPPVQLDPLTADQSADLDRGSLPLDPNYSAPDVASGVVSSLGLISRP